jgi:hypothetical protein
VETEHDLLTLCNLQSAFGVLHSADRHPHAIAAGPVEITTMKTFAVADSDAFQRLREKERTARDIFWNQPLHIPGPFQEPAYAEVLISGILGLPAGHAEVSERLRIRNQRHTALLARLQGDDAPRVHAVIDESALRRSPAGSDATRRQIEHLIEISQRPTVRIGVMPLDRGPHRGLLGSFLILDDVAFAEGAMGDQIIEGDADRVASYRDLVSSLMDEAATGEDARTLMGKLIGR